MDKDYPRKASWVRSLKVKGLSPFIQIWEECEKSEGPKREKDWAAFEKCCGCDLFNLIPKPARRPNWRGYSEALKKEITKALAFKRFCGARRDDYVPLYGGYKW